MPWLAVHVGTEGDGLAIGGAAVWRRSWRSTGEDAVRLPHPSYPHQMHDFRIYEIGSPDSPIRFAAAELSGGVWGFYVPDDPRGDARGAA